MHLGWLVVRGGGADGGGYVRRGVAVITKRTEIHMDVFNPRMRRHQHWVVKTWRVLGVPVYRVWKEVRK